MDTKIHYKFEIQEIKAVPNGLTLDELVAEMQKLGNKILRIDRQNNCLYMEV